MKPKWKKTMQKAVSVLGTLSLLTLSLSPAYAIPLPNAFVNPYDSDLPDGTITFNHPKTPGTYDNSGDFKVLGGDEMHWISQMALNGTAGDQGQYIKEKVLFPDGTEGTAIMFNDADIGNVNNGFTLVSTDPNHNDVSDWITVMQGNEEYVNKRLNDPGYKGYGTLIDLRYRMQGIPFFYSVTYGPDLAYWSGGIVQDLHTRVRADGQTGDQVVKLIPTPPPQASVVTDKSNYMRGETVNIRLTLKDWSANLGWQPDTNGRIAQDFHAETKLNKEIKKKYLVQMTPTSALGIGGGLFFSHPP